MEFSPTPAQIETAQKLFIAMAFRDVAKEAFEKMETEILQTGQYHIDEELYREALKNRDQKFPADRIVRNTEDICFIAGIKYYNTLRYVGTDADRFYTNLRERSLKAGFIQGENACSKAEMDVIRLEKELINQTKQVHGFGADEIVILNHYKKLIELLLNLFGPYVKNSSYEHNAKKYFKERFNDPAQ